MQTLMEREAGRCPGLKALLVVGSVITSVTPSRFSRISKLPASQQLVGTVTLAFDQPCTSALPLQTVCRLLEGTGISCTLRDLSNLP